MFNDHVWRAGGENIWRGGLAAQRDGVVGFAGELRERESERGDDCGEHGDARGRGQCSAYGEPRRRQQFSRGPAGESDADGEPGGGGRDVRRLGRHV